MSQEIFQSPLKTRVRCCEHRRESHINGVCIGSIVFPVGSPKCEAGDHEYSEKYGMTQIYCPACDAWCWMGTNKLRHHEGCLLSNVVLDGSVSRPHAYKTEVECQEQGIDYLGQFKLLPEGV